MSLIINMAEKTSVFNLASLTYTFNKSLNTYPEFVNLVEYLTPVKCQPRRWDFDNQKWNIEKYPYNDNDKVVLELIDKVNTVLLKNNIPITVIWNPKK